MKENLCEEKSKCNREDKSPYVNHNNSQDVICIVTRRQMDQPYISLRTVYQGEGSQNGRDF